MICEPTSQQLGRLLKCASSPVAHNATFNTLVRKIKASAASTQLNVFSMGQNRSLFNDSPFMRCLCCAMLANSSHDLQVVQETTFKMQTSLTASRAKTIPSKTPLDGSSLQFALLGTLLNHVQVCALSSWRSYLSSISLNTWESEVPFTKEFCTAELSMKWMHFLVARNWCHTTLAINAPDYMFHALHPRTSQLAWNPAWKVSTFLLRHDENAPNGVLVPLRPPVHKNQNRFFMRATSNEFGLSMPDAGNQSCQSLMNMRRDFDGLFMNARCLPDFTKRKAPGATHDIRICKLNTLGKPRKFTHVQRAITKHTLQRTHNIMGSSCLVRDFMAPSNALRVLISTPSKEAWSLNGSILSSEITDPKSFKKVRMAASVELDNTAGVIAGKSSK